MSPVVAGYCASTKAFDVIAFDNTAPTILGVNKELLQQALDALEVATTPMAKDRQEVLRAIDALRAAIAQPEQPDDHIPGVGNMVQPVQPAIMRVSEREVQLALGIYYATTGLDEFAEESIADMRKVLEAHETRKVTS